MGVEIEHKFLVVNDTWRTDADQGTVIRQGYLSESEQASVRVRVAGKRANLNIKSATLGVSRQEFEYSIPREDAEEMLDTLASGNLIEKTRYRVPYGKHVWEVDVFEGVNRGLVVAEVELHDAQDVFEKPPWVGEEVSDDPRYYNTCLAEKPYQEW